MVLVNEKREQKLLNDAKNTLKDQEFQSLRKLLLDRNLIDK